MGLLEKMVGKETIEQLRKEEDQEEYLKEKKNFQRAECGDSVCESWEENGKFTSQISSKNKSITYQEFVEGYKKGIYTVSIRKNTVGNFVLSKFADSYNKPAYLFFHWLGMILLIPLPIILIFISWPYAILSFIGGLVVRKGLGKSAIDFAVENMLVD